MFRLKKGEASSRYKPGQFVSAAYGERYRHKVVDVEAARKARVRRRLKQIQRRLAAEKEERVRTEEWELTIRYSKKGQALGITMRITAPMGTPREVVQVVARRAGLPGGTVERGFQVRDINWQRKLKTYSYGDDVETGLQVSGWSGLLEEGTIRLERVKE